MLIIISKKEINSITEKLGEVSEKFTTSYIEALDKSGIVSEVTKWVDRYFDEQEKSKSSYEKLIRENEKLKSKLLINWDDEVENTKPEQDLDYPNS